MNHSENIKLVKIIFMISVVISIIVMKIYLSMSMVYIIETLLLAIALGMIIGFFLWLIIKIIGLIIKRPLRMLTRRDLLILLFGVVCGEVLYIITNYSHDSFLLVLIMSFITYVTIIMAILGLERIKS